MKISGFLEGKCFLLKLSKKPLNKVPSMSNFLPETNAILKDLFQLEHLSKKQKSKNIFIGIP